MAISANRLELIQIADAVAREKNIDKQIVIAAMADAIQKAARSRYGQETNIRADINPNTGEMKLQRLLEVVEKVEDYATQIALVSARDRNPDAQIGDFMRPLVLPVRVGATGDPAKDTRQRAVLNLIPYNPRRNSPWPAPTEEDVTRFFGWLIEELRVQTFAQELGVRGSVSAKKLAQRVAALQR